MILNKLGIFYTYQTKLRHVLINLISNAAKLTKQGTITLDLRQVEMDGTNCVSFNVCDTGIGMTREQLEKVFQAVLHTDASQQKIMAAQIWARLLATVYAS